MSAISAVLARPRRAVPTSFTVAAAVFAAALGGAETVYRFAGPLWGATCFALVFLAVIHLAVLMGTRNATDGGQLAALLAGASLIPLERLLVLSVPELPSLRLYPDALWVIPMGVASTYAYRAAWIAGPSSRLRRLRSLGRQPLAIQAAAVAASAGLGALAALAIPYAGPHVLVYPDAAKWTGAALFALAGGAEELAWRGVLQQLATDTVGTPGIVVSFLASAYVSIAWMGPAAAVPVILLSAVTSVLVYRTRYVSGAVALHVLLNLLIIMLR